MAMSKQLSALWAPSLYRVDIGSKILLHVVEQTPLQISQKKKNLNILTSQYTTINRLAHYELTVLS